MSRFEKGDKVIITQGEFDGRWGHDRRQGHRRDELTVALGEDGREIRTHEGHVNKVEDDEVPLPRRRRRYRPAKTAIQKGGTMGTRLERLAPLAGVLFAIVFAVGFSVSGDTPDIDTSAEEVIQHYSDDTGPIFIGVMGLLLAGVLIMFFAAALRRHLATSGSDWLAGLGLAGAAIYAAGLGQFISSQIRCSTSPTRTSAMQPSHSTWRTTTTSARVRWGWPSSSSPRHGTPSRRGPCPRGWGGSPSCSDCPSRSPRVRGLPRVPIWVLLVAITIYRATPAT